MDSKFISIMGHIIRVEPTYYIYPWIIVIDSKLKCERKKWDCSSILTIHISTFWLENHSQFHIYKLVQTSQSKFNSLAKFWLQIFKKFDGGLHTHARKNGQNCKIDTFIQECCSARQLINLDHKIVVRIHSRFGSARD